MDERIIGIREEPSLLERGIGYFASRWGYVLDRKVYEDCITASLTTDSPLPRWYLLMRGDFIIGSFGLIMNDFISRQDLYPWFCALYVEESERGLNLSRKLISHGVSEAGRLGFKNLYLSTNHENYYEKSGWKHIAYGYHPWGKEKIYEISTVSHICQK